MKYKPRTCLSFAENLSFLNFDFFKIKNGRLVTSTVETNQHLLDLEQQQPMLETSVF